VTKYRFSETRGNKWKGKEKLHRDLQKYYHYNFLNNSERGQQTEEID